MNLEITPEESVLAKDIGGRSNIPPGASNSGEIASVSSRLESAESSNGVVSTSNPKSVEIIIIVRRTRVHSIACPSLSFALINLSLEISLEKYSGSSESRDSKFTDG